MRKVKAVLHGTMLAAGLLMLSAIAWAQEVTDITLDPNIHAWFESPAALAVTVVFFTSYVRTWLKLNGNAVRIVGILVGVLLAFFGSMIDALQGSWVQVLVFGIASGVLAGGGVDTFTGIFGKVAAMIAAVLAGKTSSEDAGETKPATGTLPR